MSYQSLVQSSLYGHVAGGGVLRDANTSRSWVILAVNQNNCSASNQGFPCGRCWRRSRVSRPRLPTDVMHKQQVWAGGETGGSARLSRGWTRWSTSWWPSRRWPTTTSTSRMSNQRIKLDLYSHFSPGDPPPHNWQTLMRLSSSSGHIQLYPLPFLEPT